jgi:biotin transporter BioY
MADASECRPLRRLFRPTPDRLVLALLALEGFLWLSERFRWFALNQHRGWTVLVAVAALAVFLLLMLGWFLLAVALRWRFQFSLRSLLVLPLVVALVCGWLATEIKRAKRQREAVAAIRALGGFAIYDYLVAETANRPPQSPGPEWARRILGTDFFADVIDVRSMAFAMRWLRVGSHFDSDVTRPGSNPITDAWLEQIAKLPSIEALDLQYSRVSDAGLGQIRGLTRLADLNLAATSITDAGLEHLRGTSGLRRLNLRATGVTDEGVEELRQALPKCKIED